MNIRKEVWQDICDDIWSKYEMEIFNRLKAGEQIHGNRYVRIRMQMESLGCPRPFADQFIQNQIYDIGMQIAEQAVMA